MQLSECYEKLVFQEGRKINFSRRISADYSNKAHWHPFVEILLSLEAGNEVTINFNSHTLHPNDLVVLYPGDLHSIKNVSEQSFMIIQFPVTLLSTFMEMDQILRILSRYPLVRYNPHIPDNDKLIFMFKSLFVLSDSDQPMRDLLLSSHILHFFSILGDLVLAAHPNAGSDIVSAQYKSSKLMAEACLYISQNCSDPLTLESVSHYIGISKSYFSHLFKDYTKMTFIDFLTGERIKKAEALFLSSRKKIIDIAFECGFTSISSFNRAFKKIKGISPTEFREILIERAN